MTDEWHEGMTGMPRDMFIWAYRTGRLNEKGEPEWNCGLGYWTVSGPWRDAYGHEAAVRLATHWHRMPQPPNGPG